MGNILSGKANSKAQPVGGPSLWLDAVCTQPIDELTEIDFGTFPLSSNPQNLVPASKSFSFFIRNDANYPIQVKAVIDNPAIATLAVEQGALGSPMAVGQVQPTTIRPNYKGVTDGSEIKFKITFTVDKYITS